MRTWFDRDSNRAFIEKLRATGVASLVIDCETGKLRLGLAAALSDHLGAQYVPVGEVAADQVLGVVRTAMRAEPVEVRRQAQDTSQDVA